MAGEKAIPKGYMTVGALAEKLKTTVRTLQYYDKVGLLIPSGKSEGGRRLYNDRDMVRLHQILSLKSLGFSLEEIREELILLESPEEVAGVLARQAEAIRRQIALLQINLADLLALRQEVLAMKTVDFEKYAAIITNLQIKNQDYWLIKYMDDDTLESFKHHMDLDQAKILTAEYNDLMAQASLYQRGGVDPAGTEGQRFAAAFWSMTQRFTRGDPSMLERLIEMGGRMESGEVEGPVGFDPVDFAKVAAFIGKALDHYLGALGIDPFGGGEERKNEVYD